MIACRPDFRIAGVDSIFRHMVLLCALAACGICWGATIPLSKIVLDAGHRPIGVIVWQFLVCVVVLAGVTGLRRVRLPLSWRALTHYLIIALIGTLLPNSFSLVAVAQLPAGVMSIVIASVPMFALAIALALRLEAPSFSRLTGILLGGLAVVLLVGPQASLPEPEKAVFVLVGAVAALSYGIEVNYIAVRAPVGLDPVVTLLGASVIGVLIAAPIAWAGGSFIDLTGPWGAPELALITIGVFHAIAYTGYIWLVGAAGPVFSSQISYVVTLAGVVTSALVLGETYSAWVWAALALMIGGLALVQPRRTETAEQL